MLRRTLEGVTLTVQCALPLLRKSGWGRIVTVSSNAVDGWPGLGPDQILSNVVMPGAVLTERMLKNLKDEHRKQIEINTPPRQISTPEDVVALIFFHRLPVNRQITGEIIRINGGR